MFVTKALIDFNFLFVLLIKQKHKVCYYIRLIIGLSIQSKAKLSFTI